MFTLNQKTRRDLLAASLLRPITMVGLASPAMAQQYYSKGGQPVESESERIARLEAENAAMRAELNARGRAQTPYVEVQQVQPVYAQPVYAQPVYAQPVYAQPVYPAPTPAQYPAPPAPQPAAQAAPSAQKVVGINPDYGYEILDHRRGVSQRNEIILEAIDNGELDSMVTLSGRAVVIGNAHWSNVPNKFGYLMRHPSGNNQRTKATQEIAVNSVQLALTARPAKGVTMYAEMLYDPEQSFGAGTTTALARNQIQMRKAFVMIGDKDWSPFYVSLGKMDAPFGLMDTVSPFTNSTSWHAFAPLVYGGMVGYDGGGLNVRAMAIVGGAQFRSANVPVDGTAVPSKLNNFAIDASYTLGLMEDVEVMAGGSYIHGSAYCQDYPVIHFGACQKRNPAWAAYGRIRWGRLEVIGDFAKTLRVWPGTQVPAGTNPALEAFPASKVTAFTVGARFTPPILGSKLTVSGEFSRYISGPKGSPWEKQDQWTGGVQYKLAPSVDLFSEYVRVDGFVPFNFVSGGNQPAGATWSDQDAESDVVVFGVNAAF